MTLACLAAVLNIVYAVFSFRQGTQIEIPLSSLCLGLLVPLCGYMGAKNNNQQLMCLFCGCNGLGACCACAGLGLMLVGFFALQAINTQHVDCADPGLQLDPTQCTAFAQDNICARNAATTAQLCCECVMTVLEQYPAKISMMSVMTIPSCVLSTCAFYFGKQLHDDLSQGHVIVATPTALPMAARLVQPQPSQA